MIDIIIPAYNTRKTLPKCLSSILMQSMIDDIVVIISDDASTESYDDIIKDFSNYMTIKVARHDINMGPGHARQFGVDNSNGKYIMFIDSDDTFADSHSVERLFKAIDANNLNGIITSFNAVNENGEFNTQTPQFIWVFGKIFKRDFLESNNIHFNNTRANEDVGFNKLFALMCPMDKMAASDTITYTWEYSPKSITRNSNGCYERSTCIPGFIYNNLYAYREAQKNGKTIKDMANTIIETAFSMFFNYIKLSSFHDESNNAELLRYAKQFYDEFYYKALEYVSEKEHGAIHSTTLEINNRLTFFGIIPEITFNDFKILLKNFIYKGNQPELS